MRRLAAAMAAALVLPSPAVAQAEGVERLHRIDLLPRYKDIVSVGSFSSYDRTGGNDDGFDGTHSFLRREAGGLVIAEMTGPGAVTRIWTPTPSDDVIEFYIDGETRPRIAEKFSDLFSGKRYPFVAPASVIGAGGFTSYVPIPYQKSLKVVVRAERFNFYQIGYETYRPGTRVASWRPDDPRLKTALARADALYARPGADIATAVAGSGTVLQRAAQRVTVPPRGRATLFERTAPGRIVGVRLGPAEALAGAARDMVVEVYYDGEATPSIAVPAGDLFGHAWGRPAMRSLLLGSTAQDNYFHLPMPFDRAVRVVLRSERATPVDIDAGVAFTDQGRRADEGRLYAIWKREAPTRIGRPFTFVDTPGRGHLIGAILQAQGSEPGAIPEFFEGDDTTTIDGRVAIRGTGSEDFFNGGWYDVPGRWDGPVSLPLSGSLAFKRHLARTGGYRFFPSDAYPFTRSLTQTIEHGPSGNKLATDYAAVTFLYADRRPAGAGELPPLAARAVAQPREVVFTPGWTTPIRAFSWKDATLAKADEQVGGEKLRHLQFRATGREVFGPHYIQFDCEMPAAGRYAVLIQAIAGPTQGRVQLFRDEVAVGEPAELYAPERRKTREMALGTLTLDAGPNAVMLKLVGKDARSSGMGLDLYRLIFRRID